MSVIIFIIILAVLIIVHEYGHFIVAKKGGIRVDEFGLGYPPRAKTLFRKNGTDFTLNWLPFGGFVKIFGENPDDESLNGIHKNQAFVNKSKPVQAAVLFAGPFMNFLFAWIVILATLFVGLPTAVDPSMDERFLSDQKIIITNVSKDSPADVAGILPGDVVQKVSMDGEVYDIESSENLRELVLANPQESFDLTYLRDGISENVQIKPELNSEGQVLLGIALENYALYKPNFVNAIKSSFKVTGNMIAGISVALWSLIKGIFVGGADISSLTGPVGIVGLVGEASKLGFTYLMIFTAMISINLGIINLIPFPALDGGRLLFLGIEKIKGGRVSYKILNLINFIGFGLLIILMLFISYKDIVRLINP